MTPATISNGGMSDIELVGSGIQCLKTASRFSARLKNRRIIFHHRTLLVDVVCIPFHDLKIAQSEGFRTRDSHLYYHFSRNKEVSRTIIINRPTLFGEVLLKRKSTTPLGETIYKKNGITITKITNKLFCIDVLDFSFLGPLLNGKGYISHLYTKNSKKIITGLKYLGVTDFVSYESSPLTFNLCSILSPKFRIFDGVDNLCKHPTYSKIKDDLELTYQKIINTYNSIYFNSTDSVNYFNASNIKNVTFLPNGVDFERFQAVTEEPESLRHIPRPVIVYAGKMQELLDVELIKEASNKFKSCTFLLLGKVLKKGIKEDLSICENVIFGGDIKYDDLPSYICNSDICFIPYNIEKQHGGDPIKFYEYMAANKPIVSTKIGEISKYHNGKDIFVCSRSEFINSLEEALSFNKNIFNNLPTEFTWEYKADQMLKRAHNEKHIF
ncbi:hypothetical protein PS726_04242 [Pseudomonas fluorescens]|uniref:glycosyltransferase n=1 Tax=Pseudomonas fluorescens TaxID=294 RepID=UPI0012409534|nr:glycosyltransferase [Pseudomonas fluorescens]VVO21354.1 hypothetical protein PS726_04242 [Pseudomonas fluorescens]